MFFLFTNQVCKLVMMHFNSTRNNAESTGKVSNEPATHPSMEYFLVLKQSLPENSLWHTRQSRLVLDLSHDLTLLHKDERGKKARSKILPKILPLLLDEFVFPTELLESRLKACWVLIAGLNFSNLILYRTRMPSPAKDLMLGLVSVDMCLRIHYVILLALDFVLTKIRG